MAEMNGNRAAGGAAGEQGDQDQLARRLLNLSIKFLLPIQILIQVLVNLLQVRYQNSSSSPFETHKIIMSFFIGTICVYFLALMELSRPIPNANAPNANAIYHDVAWLICYISGVLACTCIVLIIFPAFGWVILSISTIRILLLNPYITLHIKKLLDGISTILFNIYDSNDSNLENGNVPVEQEEGGGEQPEV
ncbi:uncharacterized protein LOC122292286 [Carya illinoinensis]|uniref:uncharacterized protein LOC122292286 n=1 Tax=Carya illinoinensis TaxID=32201 RepID=UPI001C722563|nr:uncharacterized protein LOC122292286 [Carya illinoinensis]